MIRLICHMSIKRFIAIILVVFMLSSTACTEDAVRNGTDSTIKGDGAVSPGSQYGGLNGDNSNENSDNSSDDFSGGDSIQNGETGNGQFGEGGATNGGEVNNSGSSSSGNHGNPSGTTGTGNGGTSNGGSQNSAGNISGGSNTSTPSGGNTESGSSNGGVTDEQKKPVFEKMPILRINTDGGSAINSKETYVTCTISSSDCPSEYVFSDVKAGIRLRGNSTMYVAKKPYRIKFDKKQTLFGINDDAKCKSWCLMADYYDHSLLRNYTAFNLGRVLLDDLYYCSDAMHAEVYINGEYQGVYLVCEQSQINKNRVDIYEKADNETSLQIGYLMIGQGGRTDEEDSIVVSLDKNITDLNGDTLYLGYMNYSLSGGPYTQEQLRYIEKWSSAAWNAVWSALYDNKYYKVNLDGSMTTKTDFPSGATTEQKQRLTIGEVLDIDSAVRMYILDEIVKNFDAGTFNMYVDLSPTGAHKLTFAAPWDYDFALGNSKYASTHSSSGLYAANFTYSDGYRTNFLFVLLNSAEWFRSDVKKIWAEKYTELLAKAEDVKSVASFGKEQFNANYVKWPTLGTTTMDHQSDDVYGYHTHMDAADNLYYWLTARIQWLNSYWLGQIQETDASVIEFSNSASLNYVENLQGAYGTIYDSSYKVVVTDTYDPYYYVDFTTLGGTVSTNKYNKLVFTCMIPESNRYDEYIAEFFLACGNNVYAEAGKSVLLAMNADGKYHTYTIDLSSLPFWYGGLNRVRVDFFVDSVVGDSFYLKSIGFAR